METLDLILAGIVVLGFIWGYKSGMFKQTSRLLGFILGFFAAKLFFLSLANYGPKIGITNIGLARIVSFFLIWIAVSLLLQVLGDILKKSFESLHLGILDRLLGAIIGGLKVVCILTIALNIFEWVDDQNELLHKDKKTASVLYYPIISIIHKAIPYTKDTLQLFKQPEKKDKDTHQDKQRSHTI
ncbi:MAG TPA: CvpA family protein [Bacteroidaceae bacterium]|nr:CvpA family protein [Bacteroidaceae bacterium]